MKLIRLKINDPEGFRSLPCGFEHYFRRDWTIEEELAAPDSFAPFVCAGPNGCGKSNLLEVLAAIFFQLEIQRVRRSFLPEVLQEALQEKTFNFSPTAFELEYVIRVPKEYVKTNGTEWARVKVTKEIGQTVTTSWENQTEFDAHTMEFVTGEILDILLPQYVLGYSSGENEILSLPFFKTRFVQFDEYWNALTQQLSYPGRPEARLAYLDNSFSQAILLCNLLFQDKGAPRPFFDDVGIEELKEFRIILRRSISVTRQQVGTFTTGDYALSNEMQNGRFKDTNAIYLDSESGDYRLNLLHILEANERAKFTSVVEKLKRCSTIHFHDEKSDTLILDYWVNEKTKAAFRANFDDSALTLFQALQVLLTLNLYSVSSTIKSDLYTSTSHYVSETIPVLASDQRIMRFKFVRFTKRGVAEPIMLKELSDGEHQLLHSLGLCFLFRNTNSLILLDEPETHFNPSWRASFISQLKACLGDSENTPEMLITTHSPFLISDSKRNKVLEFEKDPETRHVKITNPEYNTFGASINKITMSTFNKRETIGGQAQEKLDSFRERSKEPNINYGELIRELDNELGDSVEKILLIKAILGAHQPNTDEVQS